MRTRLQLKAAAHFPSLGHDLNPSGSMFSQDVALAIVPTRMRDNPSVTAKVTGDTADIKRIELILGSFEKSHRRNLTELLGDAIRSIAENLSWEGRATYEITKRGEDEIALYGFTTRNLFWLPPFYLQYIPLADHEVWQRSFSLIPTRDVWDISMPRALGGARGYRRMLRNIRSRSQMSPKFWQQDLERGTFTTPNFNFTEYRRYVELFEAESTRKWGWSRRDFSGKNWTEFALFYRMITFRWAQAVLREHIIAELNSLFGRFGIKALVELDGLAGPNKILSLRNEMVVGNMSYAKVSELTSIR